MVLSRSWALLPPDMDRCANLPLLNYHFRGGRKLGFIIIIMVFIINGLHSTWRTFRMLDIAPSCWRRFRSGTASFPITLHFSPCTRFTSDILVGLSYHTSCMLRSSFHRTPQAHSRFVNESLIHNHTREKNTCERNRGVPPNTKLCCVPVSVAWWLRS